MTRHFKNLALAALLCAVAVFVAAGSARAEMKLVPLVDSFVFFADHSGSMAFKHKDTGEKKITMSKELMGKINSKIPALGYDGKLVTFAPYAGVWGGKYDKAALGAGIDGLSDSYDVYGRKTPLGRGFMELGKNIGDLPGKIAIIVFADGENNMGPDAVTEAEALARQYMGKACLHVVSFADNDADQANLDAIAALNRCSISVSGTALLADEAALDKFVQDVFFKEEMMHKPMKKEVEEYEPIAVVVPLRVNFDFDSSAIKDEMIPVLEEAASLLKEGASATVVGHTDSIGSEEYNQGLSERRAEAVKGFLVKQGVSASTLTTMGYGETAPKYDNGTSEGRALNRRVELRIQ